MHKAGISLAQVNTTRHQAPPGAGHGPSRPLKAIVTNGNEPELIAALRDLPGGLCDLRDIELDVSAAALLASAVQAVAIDRLVLGSYFDAKTLLEAIPYSKVREWDFVSSIRVFGYKGWSASFPSTREAQQLATLLPQLHRDSVTKRIVLSKDACAASDEISELLAPFGEAGNSQRTGLADGTGCLVLTDRASYPVSATASASTEDLWAAPQDTPTWARPEEDSRPADRSAAPKQPAPSQVDFNGVKMALARFIPKGNSAIVIGALAPGGQRRPFSDGEMNELRNMAKPFENHPDPHVRQAALDALSYL